jgi:hypothetical protein
MADQETLSRQQKLWMVAAALRKNRPWLFWKTVAIGIALSVPLAWFFAYDHTGFAAFLFSSFIHLGMPLLLIFVVGVGS